MVSKNKNKGDYIMANVLQEFKEDLVINSMSKQTYDDLVSQSQIQDNQLYLVTEDNMDARNNRVVNVGTPVELNDATTKEYVDLEIQNVKNTVLSSNTILKDIYTVPDSEIILSSNVFSYKINLSSDLSVSINAGDITNLENKLVTFNVLIKSTDVKYTIDWSSNIYFKDNIYPSCEPNTVDIIEFVTLDNINYFGSLKNTITV